MVLFGYGGQFHTSLLLLDLDYSSRFCPFPGERSLENGRSLQFDFPIVGVLPGTLIKVLSRPPVPVQLLKSTMVTVATKWMGSSDFDDLNKTTSQTAGRGLKTKQRQQTKQAAKQNK